MSKLIIKFLFVPALLIGGLSFYSYTKTGKIPFVDKDALSSLFNTGSSNSTAELRSKITKKENINTSQDKQTFYKWKDNNGRWHYGTEAPENTASKSVDYDPTSNRVAAVKVDFTSKKKEGKSGSTSEITGNASEALDPTKIMDTINDAQNMQQMVNDRHAAQMEQINNLR